MSTPADGRTPGAPDVDQPDGGAHGGPGDRGTGRAPRAPDVDQPDGGAHGSAAEE